MHLKLMILRVVVLLAGARAGALAQAPASNEDPARGAVLRSAAWTVIPAAGGVALAAIGGGTGQTVTSGVLMWGGFIAGPSAGYLMSGRGRLARTGVLLRAGTFALAWAASPTEDFDDGFLPNPQLDALGPWVAAVPLIAVSAIVDVAMAGRRIRGAPAQMQVLPVRPRSGGVGVAVAARWLP